VATVSEYLGKHCSVHVAEYTALLMGLDIALKRGMKHLTIMCDSLTVFNQVGTYEYTATGTSMLLLQMRVVVRVHSCASRCEAP
jgi:ribonuclease HI